MSIFGKKKIECKLKEDKTGAKCRKYSEDKAGNKHTEATIDFDINPDGTINTLNHDGTSDDIKELTLHGLNSVKKSKATGEF